MNVCESACGILCDCAFYRSLSYIRYWLIVSSRILNECVFISEPKKRQCKVLFEYVPQNEDELELKVGDIIDITEEVRKGTIYASALNVCCIYCGFKTAPNMFVLLFIEILTSNEKIFACMQHCCMHEHAVSH